MTYFLVSLVRAFLGLLCRTGWVRWEESYKRCHSWVMTKLRALVELMDAPAELRQLEPGSYARRPSSQLGYAVHLPRQQGEWSGQWSCQPRSSLRAGKIQVSGWISNYWEALPGCELFWHLKMKRPGGLESTDSQNLSNYFIKITYFSSGVGGVHRIQVCSLLCTAQKLLAEEARPDWMVACVLITKACT